MGQKIIETDVMPRNEEHREVAEHMRFHLDQVETVFVKSSGWVMVRFKDLGLRIAGVLPLDLSWMGGILTEVVGFSTSPVEKTSSQHADLPLRYQLHLRLLPIEGDPHAIGHNFHQDQPLLQEPVRLDDKDRARRALPRTGRGIQRT